MAEESNTQTSQAISSTHYRLPKKLTSGLRPGIKIRQTGWTQDFTGHRCQLQEILNLCVTILLEFLPKNVIDN